MAGLLEQAIAQLKTLPDGEQNTVATCLLVEMKDEQT